MLCMSEFIILSESANPVIVTSDDDTNAPR